MTTQSERSTNLASRAGIWAALERQRNASMAFEPIPSLAAPLGGLLVLRWAAHMYAEAEAVSAFDDTPFSTHLPKALGQQSWANARGLASRLEAGLAEIGRPRNGATDRYIEAVAPCVVLTYTLLTKNIPHVLFGGSSTEAVQGLLKLAEGVK